MITNGDMDTTFHALAHTTRRTILDRVRAEPGVTVGKMASKFDVSRIAVMNHLAVLEKAGLIISRKDGRSRRLYMNVMPIQDIYDRWTDTFSAHWADRVSIIKHAAETAARKSEGENEND